MLGWVTTRCGRWTYGRTGFWYHSVRMNGREEELWKSSTP
jgi:hypothetical protein